MGAWTDYVLLPDVLNGLSRGDAFAVVDDETLAQARRTFQKHVMAKIGSTVLREGSETAFFDKAAVKTELFDRIDDGLGAFYLFHHFDDGAGRAGRGLTSEKRADRFHTEAKIAVTAFCVAAPVAIGTYENRSTVAHNASMMVSYSRAGEQRTIETL